MNNRGELIVTLAAWLIVIAFTVKLVVVLAVGASVLSSKGRKSNLTACNEVHLALQEE